MCTILAKRGRQTRASQQIFVIDLPFPVYQLAYHFDVASSKRFCP